jgi:soluble lytic murein transglycosylase
MSRPSHLAGVCFLLSFAFVVLGCNEETPPDIGPPVDASADPTAWVEAAEALLAQGRPWRAARVMEAYRDAVDDLPPEHRLLAARADAGWDHWSAVGDVLEGAAGLDSLGQGLGLYLLARARDEAGEASEAAALYRSFLDAAPEERYADERAAARLRLGLALLQTGDEQEGDAVLEAVADAMGPAALWVDLLKAEALARAGRAEAARLAAERYDRGIPGLRARRALVEAARARGDLERARALAREGYGWARSDATRAEFELIEGRLAIEQGDVEAGRAALRAAVDLNAAGAYGQQAAALLREGPMTPADHLASARVYAGLGLHDQAAEDFRAWLASDAGTPGEREEVRLALAESLVDGQMYEEAIDVLEPLGEDRAARDLRASALSRAGRTEAAAAIYRRLAAEQRGTDDGAAALYFAADAYQQGGDADAARPLYRDVVETYPGTRWMGLALMRLAGLAFLDGDYGEAATLWDRYRTRYPNGRLALQSTYWAARARAEAGKADEAERLFRRVRQRDRDSYYALKASELLGEPFWPLPMGEAPPRDRAAEQRVAGWMAPVDRLREAGFYDAASAEVGRIVDRAGSGRAVRYALAEALAERGYTQRAIRLGLTLQRGRTNPRLLRILYPYPYRELIQAEAEEREFASSIAAALVRQESMFEARITSHVGARGLMQIMPATGAELAEAYGLEAWDRDYLYQPEINAHLGAGYIADGLDAYDGSLPAVFAAYNAGPHQVEQWRTFPEFDADDELFTERIPFRETRDYVKKLTRNRALYEGLYGEADEAD